MLDDILMRDFLRDFTHLINRQTYLSTPHETLQAFEAFYQEIQKEIISLEFDSETLRKMKGTEAKQIAIREAINARSAFLKMFHQHYFRACYQMIFGEHKFLTKEALTLFREQCPQSSHTLNPIDSLRQDQIAKLQIDYTYRIEAILNYIKYIKDIQTTFSNIDKATAEQSTRKKIRFFSHCSKSGGYSETGTVMTFSPEETNKLITQFQGKMQEACEKLSDLLQGELFEKASLENVPEHVRDIVEPRIKEFYLEKVNHNLIVEITTDNNQLHIKPQNINNKQYHENKALIETECNKRLAVLKDKFLFFKTLDSLKAEYKHLNKVYVEKIKALKGLFPEVNLPQSIATNPILANYYYQMIALLENGRLPPHDPFVIDFFLEFTNSPKDAHQSYTTYLQRIDEIIKIETKYKLCERILNHVNNHGQITELTPELYHKITDTTTITLPQNLMRFSQEMSLLQHIFYLNKYKGIDRGRLANLLQELSDVWPNVIPLDEVETLFNKKFTHKQLVDVANHLTNFIKLQKVEKAAPVTDEALQGMRLAHLAEEQFQEYKTHKDSLISTAEDLKHRGNTPLSEETIHRMFDYSEKHQALLAEQNAYIKHVTQIHSTNYCDIDVLIKEHCKLISIENHYNLAISEGLAQLERLLNLLDTTHTLSDIINYNLIFKTYQLYAPRIFNPFGRLERFLKNQKAKAHPTQQALLEEIHNLIERLNRLCEDNAMVNIELETIECVFEHVHEKPAPQEMRDIIKQNFQEIRDLTDSIREEIQEQSLYQTEPAKINYAQLEKITNNPVYSKKQLLSAIKQALYNNNYVTETAFYFLSPDDATFLSETINHIKDNFTACQELVQMDTFAVGTVRSLDETGINNIENVRESFASNNVFNYTDIQPYQALNETAQLVGESCDTQLYYYKTHGDYYIYQQIEKIINQFVERLKTNYLTVFKNIENNAEAALGLEQLLSDKHLDEDGLKKWLDKLERKHKFKSKINFLKDYKLFRQKIDFLIGCLSKQDISYLHFDLAINWSSHQETPLISIAEKNNQRLIDKYQENVAKLKQQTIPADDPVKTTLHNIKLAQAEAILAEIKAIDARFKAQQEAISPQHTITHKLQYLYILEQELEACGIHYKTACANQNADLYEYYTKYGARIIATIKEVKETLDDLSEHWKADYEALKASQKSIAIPNGEATRSYLQTLTNTSKQMLRGFVAKNFVRTEKGLMIRNSNPLGNPIPFNILGKLQAFVCAPFFINEGHNLAKAGVDHGVMSTEFFKATGWFICLQVAFEPEAYYATARCFARWPRIASSIRFIGKSIHVTTPFLLAYGVYHLGKKNGQIKEEMTDIAINAQAFYLDSRPALRDSYLYLSNTGFVNWFLDGPSTMCYNWTVDALQSSEYISASVDETFGWADVTYFDGMDAFLREVDILSAGKKHSLKLIQEDYKASIQASFNVSHNKTLFEACGLEMLSFMNIIPEWGKNKALPLIYTTKGTKLQLTPAYTPLTLVKSGMDITKLVMLFEYEDDTYEAIIPRQTISYSSRQISPQRNRLQLSKQQLPLFIASLQKKGISCLYLDVGAVEKTSPTPNIASLHEEAIERYVDDASYTKYTIGAWCNIPELMYQDENEHPIYLPQFRKTLEAFAKENHVDKVLQAAQHYKSFLDGQTKAVRMDYYVAMPTSRHFITTYELARDYRPEDIVFVASRECEVLVEHKSGEDTYFTPMKRYRYELKQVDGAYVFPEKEINYQTLQALQITNPHLCFVREATLNDIQLFTPMMVLKPQLHIGAHMDFMSREEILKAYDSRYVWYVGFIKTKKETAYIISSIDGSMKTKIFEDIDDLYTFMASPLVKGHVFMKTCDLKEDYAYFARKTSIYEIGRNQDFISKPSYQTPVVHYFCQETTNDQYILFTNNKAKPLFSGTKEALIQYANKHLAAKQLIEDISYLNQRAPLYQYPTSTNKTPLVPRTLLDYYITQPR